MPASIPWSALKIDSYYQWFHTIFHIEPLDVLPCQVSWRILNVLIDTSFIGSPCNPYLIYRHHRIVLALKVKRVVVIEIAFCHKSTGDRRPWGIEGLVVDTLNVHSKVSNRHHGRAITLNIRHRQVCAIKLACASRWHICSLVLVEVWELVENVYRCINNGGNSECNVACLA